MVTRLTIYHYLCAIFSISVVLSATAVPAFAPSQLAVIQKRGYIRVGIFTNSSEPFIIEDKKTHQLTGIDIDMANRIGEALGVKVVFDTSAKKYNDLMNQAYTHQDDIVMSGLVRTPIRDESIYLSEPYYKFRIGVLVNRMRYDQLSESILTVFNKSTVTMSEFYDSAYTSYVKYLYPQAKITYFKTNQQEFNAIQTNQIDAIMIDELVAQSWLKAKPERALMVRYYLIPGLYAEYSIGTSYDYPVLGKWLNVFIREAIDIGFTDKLLKKYARGNIHAS